MIHYPRRIRVGTDQPKLEKEGSCCVSVPALLLDHVSPSHAWVRITKLECCCSVAHHVRLFVIPWTAARQASLSSTIFWSSLKLMPTELMMPSNHLIFCRPLLLLPSILSSISVFSSETLEQSFQFPDFRNMSPVDPGQLERPGI